MDDPIQALIAANPTPIVVQVSQVAGYDPDQTYPTPESPDPQPSKNCLFVRVVNTGLVTAYTATATLALADFPDAPPEATQADVGGQSYTIKAVRKRFFQGQQNGWTLELE